MAEVSIKNLIKNYGSENIVKDISLNINDKEFIVLVGPSGCGKSTTLRMIAGLEDINSGEIKIGDKVVNNLPPRLRNIAMVFQSYALYPHMSVKENLEFGLRILKKDKKFIDEKVTYASEILGLNDYLNRKPADLSGGQRQRVAMGRAIVREPDVFLFDEPLSNLDAKLRNKMRTEIKKLHLNLQKTIVYVTHDQVEAMTLADRIVIMRDGIIEQVGTALEVFNNPINKFVATFIGSPSMNLANAIIEGEFIVLKDGLKVPLCSKFKGKIKEGQNVIFGIRSDSIATVKHQNIKNIFSFKRDVLIEEPLGTETHLFISVGDGEFVSRMNHPRPVSVGEEMEFFMNLDKTYLFDANSEKSLI